ncbi:hypothetical protein ACWEN3_22465 [Streptomyces sp. NPDC004561]
MAPPHTATVPRPGDRAGSAECGTSPLVVHGPMDLLFGGLLAMARTAARTPTAVPEAPLGRAAGT